MTIIEYKELSRDEKLTKLKEHGHYMIHLDILDQTFMLFKLWEFHVEVCYDPSLDAIVSLRPFDDSQDLTPYLDALRLHKSR